MEKWIRTPVKGGALFDQAGPGNTPGDLVFIHDMDFWRTDAPTGTRRITYIRAVIDEEGKPRLEYLCVTSDQANG